MSCRLAKKQRKHWRRCAEVQKAIRALSGEPEPFRLKMWTSIPFKLPAKTTYTGGLGAFSVAEFDEIAAAVNAARGKP